jgi:hypothetical protein
VRSSNITAMRSIWRDGCKTVARTTLAVGFMVALVQGCSRTGLYIPGVDGGEEEEPVPCEEGDVAPCGSDVGACAPGLRACVDGLLGECTGAIEPVAEQCNAIDDDCDGTTDEGFKLGEACDGPDSDLCADDVVVCGGCSRGDDTLETCNGVDDDCDGIVDADCESGDCGPTLLVTGSVPSSPGCVDFPVQAGSTGAIEYPCGGGSVTATLGEVAFTGGVQNGQVSLGGTVVISADRSPDGCVWETKHQISGSVGSGTLTYSYSEMWITGTECWSPCTETGTVEIKWVE